MPPCLPDDVLDDLLLPGYMRLAALVADEGQADLSSFQPRRWRTFISPLLIKEEIEMRLDFFLVQRRTPSPLRPRLE